MKGVREDILWDNDSKGRETEFRAVQVRLRCDAGH